MRICRHFICYVGMIRAPSHGRELRILIRIYSNAERVVLWELSVVVQNVRKFVILDMTASKLIVVTDDCH